MERTIVCISLTWLTGTYIYYFLKTGYLSCFLLVIIIILFSKAAYNFYKLKRPSIYFYWPVILKLSLSSISSLLWTPLTVYYYHTHKVINYHQYGNDGISSLNKMSSLFNRVMDREAVVIDFLDYWAYKCITLAQTILILLLLCTKFDQDLKFFILNNVKMRIFKE